MLWWTLAAAALCGIAIIALSMQGPAKSAQTNGGAGEKVTFGDVETVVATRCSMCHAAEPVWEGITTAPRGIRLDDAEHIRRNARLIGRNAAWASAMPPGNVTEMTADERALIAAWMESEMRY